MCYRSITQYPWYVYEEDIHISYIYVYTLSEPVSPVTMIVEVQTGGSSLYIQKIEIMYH
jgi:hypothetical protein